MERFFSDSSLADIREKVQKGERLSREDGIRLYRSKDLLQVGWLANLVKHRISGNKVYFTVNLHINYTNVCILSCKFCGFARKLGEEGAYTQSLDEIVRMAGAAAKLGAHEFHIVGGLHPGLPFQYYLDLLRTLRDNFPQVDLKAFTAVEIDYFSRISRLSVEEVLKKLIDAGLTSLPGGGAEVLSDRCRDLAWADKIPPARWLEVIRTAHKLGLKSNATLLYGTVETAEERVDHLIRLRELQDETGGFLTFIPLAFQPENNELGYLGPTSGVDDLRTIAVARLMLENFPHIKSYWAMLGLKTAQVGLHFGADDLDGTIMRERIAHASGAESPLGTEKEQLIRMIREAGFVPVERDAVYRVVRVHG